MCEADQENEIDAEEPGSTVRGYRLRSYSTGERRGFPAASDAGPDDFRGDTGRTEHMANLHRIRRHVHSAEAPGLGYLPVHAGRQGTARRQMGAVESLQHLGSDRPSGLDL